MKRMEAFCEETVSLLLTAYLFIVFCMFPFYLKNGYMEIGKEKYNFYKIITIGGFGLIIPLVLLCLAAHIVNWKRDRKRAAGEAAGGPEGTEDSVSAERAEAAEDSGEEDMPEPYAIWRGKLSGTDWAVLAYGLSVILSYIGSEYKHTALVGEKGWYMGAEMQLVFVLSYFLVSRFWEYGEKILFPVMAASGAVFFLGILNRFSIFPFLIEGANSSFLSTMGNINWYCGYWAVIFPIGFLMYWKADGLWMRIAGLLFSTVGIAAGISQGSNSAFLVFAGLYIFLFCISFRDMESMKRFFQLVILFCAVCQGLRLWRWLRPAAFNYYSGTVSDWITLSSITMAGLILSVIVYFFLWLAERKLHPDMRRFKMIRQIMLLMTVIVIGVYILLLILNSRVKGGIRSMGELSALVFSRQWGSSRGGTWSAGLRIYRNMPGLKKLIGVGPDCFAKSLYTIPDLAESVNKQFNGSRLTNAHNEWLNMLVNVGIFGFISYGGIFVSAVIRFVYYGEKVFKGKGKYLCIFGFSAFAYTLHNVVSFQQILSTPFMFLMLGMGEGLVRTEKYKELTNTDF